jgi:hypothetical protein
MDNIQQQVKALAGAIDTGAIPARDAEFARKLVSAYGNGKLTFNMAQWVPRLLERVAQAAVPNAVISVKGVVALLNHAKSSGLKFPKLWLQLPDGSPLRITIAGDKSKTPGFVMLTDGGGFGVGKYFGKISQAGELMLGKDGFAVRDALTELLTRLAADPAKVAAEFGHLTGHCCFCSLRLNDERSVSVGYGPVCADKFGLAWGVRAPHVPSRKKKATPSA